MGGTFRALRNRNFRLYAGGLLVSNIGTWTQRIAQDWLILTLTAGSGVALGTATALQFLPMLVLAPWGGALADRFPKRRILFSTQSVMCVLALTLGVLDLTGRAEVWHVYVLATLLGITMAVDNPTRQSFVVEMVGEEDLTSAVGINGALFNLGRLIGPAPAGLMIAAWGTAPVFFVNTASFAAMLVAVLAMRPAELYRLRRSGDRRLRVGLAYVRSRGDLILILTLTFLVSTFALNLSVTTVLMAREEFGRDAGGFGLLASVLAVGSVAGALLVARRGEPSVPVVAGAAVTAGALHAASGMMPGFWTFAAVLALVGAVSVTASISANTRVQLNVESRLRGRVMALYVMAWFGGGPVGVIGAGAVADTHGARWSVIAGGLAECAAALIATGVYAWTRRRKDTVRRWAPRAARTASPRAGSPPAP